MKNSRTRNISIVASLLLIGNLLLPLAGKAGIVAPVFNNGTGTVTVVGTATTMTTNQTRTVVSHQGINVLSDTIRVNQPGSGSVTLFRGNASGYGPNISSNGGLGFFGTVISFNGAVASPSAVFSGLSTLTAQNFTNWANGGSLVLATSPGTIPNLTNYSGLTRVGVDTYTVLPAGVSISLPNTSSGSSSTSAAPVVSSTTASSTVTPASAWGTSSTATTTPYKAPTTTFASYTPPASFTGAPSFQTSAVSGLPNTPVMSVTSWVYKPSTSGSAIPTGISMPPGVLPSGTTPGSYMPTGGSMPASMSMPPGAMPPSGSTTGTTSGGYNMSPGGSNYGTPSPGMMPPSGMPPGMTGPPAGFNPNQSGSGILPGGGTWNYNADTHTGSMTNAQGQTFTNTFKAGEAPGQSQIGPGQQPSQAPANSNTVPATVPSAPSDPQTAPGNAPLTDDKKPK